MSEKEKMNDKNGSKSGYGTIDDVEIQLVERNSDNQNECTSVKSTYFNDGKRRIDFVIVYEETCPVDESASSSSDKQKLDETKVEKKNRKWRTNFIENLKDLSKVHPNLAGKGLDIEEEVSNVDKKELHFIKLHCPWSVIAHFAEDLSFKAPLQAHQRPTVNWSDRILTTLNVPNVMKEEVPYKPLDFNTATFKLSKLSSYLGNENVDTFFTNRERQRIVWEILVSVVYGKSTECGIERLIDCGAFVAAYPLHDGPYEMPKSNEQGDKEEINMRQILYEYWGRWGKWYKYQPLDHIRDYFGEKIGIYFAWLGFYTAWLIPASVVGILVFFYGVASMFWDVPAKEICESKDQFKMCPLCDNGCGYWNMSSVCFYQKLAYLFDHPGTVFYAVFMSFWAVTFLEYWKRKNVSLAHHWDCLGYEEEDERPRPEYAALAPAKEKNPITGVMEPHFPPRKRLPRLLSGIAVILIMMVLVIIFIVAVILYRIIIAVPIVKNPVLRPRAQTIASMTAAVVNLILIMALGKVYEILAHKLTQWEMHRTQTEFEDHFIYKVFIFQFVNFYSSIIYVGFFKGKFVGYPGHYTHFFGLRNEECQNGGCLIELAQQLGVIMIGKQMINNAQELIVPKIKGFIQKWKRGSTRKKGEIVERPQWEEDFDLIESEGLFAEYLEMVLQFGFITIFVAAFPLAPLFALLNNWIEIRLDASKFVSETRRPVAERCEDIGVWFTILDALAQLAVISNAFLIAFTSTFLPKLLYKYHYRWDLKGYVNFSLAIAPPDSGYNETCRYQAFRDPDGKETTFYWNLLAVRLGFIILFEHVVFGICRLIDILVPDVPESLEIKIKRERYLAKQALADINVSNPITSVEEES